MKSNLKLFLALLLVLPLFGLALPNEADAKNKIYYSQERPDAPAPYYPVYQMTLKGKKNQKLLINGLDINAQQGIAVSPDGDKIAYACASGTFKVCIMDIDTGNEIVIDEYVDGIDHQPSWSPDGDKVVFTREEYYGDYLIARVYTAKADGSESAQQITQPRYAPADSYNPSYSPDGDTIIFDNDKNIYTMESTYGADPTKLTNCKKCLEPRFSPNGKKIVYTRKSGKYYQLYTMKTNGKQKQKLTRQGKARTPYYSPNSKKIFFSYKKPGKSTFDVYSLKLKSNKLKRLTKNNYNNVRPTVGNIK